MTYEGKHPLNIDDCWDAKSIREKLKKFDTMHSFGYDDAGSFSALRAELNRRLRELGEE